jgi:hypothetical protein
MDVNRGYDILRGYRRVRVRFLRAYLPSRERQGLCQPTSSTRYAGLDLLSCMIPVMDVKTQKFILKLCVLTEQSSVLIRPYAPTCLDHVRTVIKRKRLFRRNHFYFDILVLHLHVQCKYWQQYDLIRRDRLGEALR